MRVSSPIRAILFDCDGTLVDSEEAHHEGFKRALFDLGHAIPELDHSLYAGRADFFVAEHLSEKFALSSIADLLQKKSAHYLNLCKKGLPPIEPTLRFLHKLPHLKVSHSLKVGVCSAAKKKEVLFHLQHLGIEEVMDIVLAGEEDLQDYVDPAGVNKPKPYIYLKAAKKLGLFPHECIAIEDSYTGVAAAAAAGCYTVAIPNKYTKSHDFSLAHRVIHSLEYVDPQDFLIKCIF